MRLLPRPILAPVLAAVQISHPGDLAATAKVAPELVEEKFLVPRDLAATCNPRRSRARRCQVAKSQISTFSRFFDSNLTLDDFKA